MTTEIDETLATYRMHLEEILTVRYIISQHDPEDTTPKHPCTVAAEQVVREMVGDLDADDLREVLTLALLRWTSHPCE